MKTVVMTMLSSWLKNIPDKTLVSDINLPGTHDSCANHVIFGYFTKCQNLSVREQLDIGIRFIDLRIEKAEKEHKTVHAVINCRKRAFSPALLYVGDVLNEIKAFLRENPSETVLVCLKRDDGAGDRETFADFYHKYIENDDIWFTRNRVPQLGEVRGKIVLLNRNQVPENAVFTDENRGLDLSPWRTPGDTFIGEKAIEDIPLTNGEKSGETYVVQDFYKFSPKKKWQSAILPALNFQCPERTVFINFFSANNSIVSPRGYTRFLFPKFYDHTLKKGKKYGWLILDFPSDKICEKIIETN